VECWIRPTTLTITATFYGKVIFDTRASGGSSGGGVLYVKFGVLNFYTGGVNIAGSIAFVADDWIHVAVTRSGSDIKIWQGGVQTGTTLTNSSNLSDGLFAISVETIANQSWFDGYIDEFRITNGVARYTTTFTPPTVQFTNPSFGTPPFYFTAGQYSCATTGGTHSQQIFPRASSQSSTAPSGFTAYAPPDYSVSISLNENPAVPITSPLNAIVDWGDGSFVTYTVAGTYTHTYAAASPYTVSISGTCAAVDTLADPAFLGVNSWNAYLGLQTLNAAAYSTNSVYVPSNLPYTLQRVRISGTFNSSTVVSWDTSNLTDMSSMFAGAIGFNQDISGWNTGAVTTMASMFAGRTTFNQPLNSWDTALVTNMSSMFSGASAFNQPLANWNTHLVTNMNSMFSNASVFNQDISLWCVYLIPSLPSGFNTGGTLTGGYFPVWGTCPIVNPFPIVLTGPTYGVFTGNPATTFPITLTGPTYGVFTGNPTTTLPITLSR
jgi:surface protein